MYKKKASLKKKENLHGQGDEIRVKVYLTTIKQKLDVRILGELTISR